MAMAMASESDDDDDEGNPDLLLLTLLNLNDQEEEEEVEQQLNLKLKLKLKPKPSQNQELDQQHYLKSIDSTLTIRQLPSQGLSFQLWPAASTLVSLLSLSSPLRILELGSGTGLLGHSAAAILRAHVTLTDLPHVIPNLHFNAAANAPLIASRGGSIAFQELSWGEDNQIGEFDVVIASDVVYYDHLFEPLLRTLRGFVKGEVGFVMGHLKRWKKRDAVFFKKARKVFDAEMIHRDMPLPGSRIGVAVYRFTAKKNGL